MRNKFALVCAASVLGVGASFAMLGYARAADLPSHKSAPLPPAPSLSWTGFYSGVDAGAIFNGGGAVVEATGTVSSGANPANLTAQPYYLPGKLVMNDAGFFGGGVIGVNWQISRFVVGVEADGGAVFGSEHTQSFATPGISGAASFSQVGRTADMIGSAKGRIGLLITPSVLLYGTAGPGIGHANTSVGTFSGPIIATYAPPTLGSWRTGWLAGGGIEWMASPLVSFKLEYHHFDLGTGTFETGAISNPVFPTIQTVIGQTKYRGDLVKVGVNLHFNGLTALTGHPITDFGLPTTTGNVTADGKAFQTWWQSQAANWGLPTVSGLLSL